MNLEPFKTSAEQRAYDAATEAVEQSKRLNENPFNWEANGIAQTINRLWEAREAESRGSAIPAFFNRATQRRWIKQTEKDYQ